ncbi:MAG: DUF151 domain-containing protein [Spirochaetia bacterium]|nr:DUF151 domain-containing protein [Spirochaetia bacterium]
MLEIEIVEVSVTQMGFALMLKTPSRPGIVPIFIGPLETYSISAALEGQKTERPLTHDLVKNLLQVIDATVEKIVINDFKGGTFYARLYLKFNGKDKKNEVIDIDSRPSDGIALALRFKSPIYMEEFVFEQTAVDAALIKEKRQSKDEDLITITDENLDDPETDESIQAMLEALKGKEELAKKGDKSQLKEDEFKSKKEVLEQMLKVAITKEHYEEAAAIRDEIKSLKSNHKNKDRKKEDNRNKSLDN